MRRRQVLRALPGTAAVAAFGLASLPLRLARAEPVASTDGPHIAAAWSLTAGAVQEGRHHVGILHLNEAARRVQLLAQLQVPTRAHGLLALHDGGFLAVAQRPGRWLVRCDRDCKPLQWLHLNGATETRFFTGHAELAAQPMVRAHAVPSAAADWLFTAETDPDTGQGWIGVRDLRTLQLAAQFPSAGIDPHQLCLGPDDTLWMANGGIARDAAGRKIDSERLASSLVRIQPGTGQMLGCWTLPDAQLSIRHMAWAKGSPDLLGLALQAEHALLQQRAQAPALALWDGQALSLPSDDSRAAGYAGDIAAGPGGGFVISAQKQGCGLCWHPRQPRELALVAQLTEPCALLPLSDGQGVWIAAARGVARWHAQHAPQLWPWPVPLLPDNHWVELLRT